MRGLDPRICRWRKSVAGSFSLSLLLSVTLTKVRVQLGAVKLDSGFRRNDDGERVMRGLDPRICRVKEDGRITSGYWGDEERDSRVKPVNDV